jgi:pyruvate kinase
VARLIVTVGPSSIGESVLHSLKEAGASSFRINLSHSNPTSLADYFDALQRCDIMPAIDTQGAQLRVIDFSADFNFKVNSSVTLHFGSIKASSKTESYILINHPEAANQCLPGDILKIDFSGLALRIERQLSTSSFECIVIATGALILNRAVDIQGKSIALNPLTDFDKYAIEYSVARGCKEVYASFASSAQDVLEIKNFISDSSCRLISKIESKAGVRNTREICLNSDEILIDRGDLSREITITSVPIAVSSIISIANSLSTPVNIATNVLDSMLTSCVPSRAEVSDIFSLVEKGVSGFVLAAEVAIGQNPVSSAALISYLTQCYERYQEGLFGISDNPLPSSDLIGAELSQWL